MWLNPLFDAHSNFTSQSNASRDDKCCEVEVDIDGSTKREYFVQILQYRPLNGPPARELNFSPKSLYYKTLNKKITVLY